MSAPARWATAPTPGARHEQRHVELMARLLGTPLMPWQSQVARVVTERREDGRGWRYPIVVLTVPRQSGKTTLMRAVMAQRTLRYPRTQAFYTAQSGKDARERWRDLVDIADIKFPNLVSIKRGAGAECMEWHNGHGQVRTFAPTRKALHGYTPELVMLDEAFAYDEDLGAALMAAIVPAQSTLDERQLWIVSTMGDADSSWFHAWVGRGREAALDPMSSMAFFEWSATDEMDLSKPETFTLFHPAVGHTQTTATLAEARESMTESEYARAFGNRRTVSKKRVVPPAVVEAATNLAQVPPESMGAAVAAYDVAPDRSWATLWIAWSDDQGNHLRPWLSKPGVWWLPSEVAVLQERGIGTVAADDGGPARSVTSALRLAGTEVETLGARDFASATGDLIEALTLGTVDHSGSQELIDGLDGATLRRMGETEAWSRRDSTGPIWAVVAATVALRALTYSPATPNPMVVSA